MSTKVKSNSIIPKIELISIGNEILHGWTVNTNASWLAQHLSLLGLSVGWITTIPDAEQEIISALQTAKQRADVILSTGGLGPTPDDITKNALCKFFNTEMILHEQTLTKIKKIFEGRNLIMPEINRNQAMVPGSADLIDNPFGSAPGLLFKKDNKLIIFLPGVPMEMKAIYETHLITLLKDHLALPGIRTVIMRTTGLAESKVYEMLENTLKTYPQFQVSFLPKSSGVDIRVNYVSERLESPNILDSFCENMRKDLKDYIYAETEKELPEIVGMLLRERSLTLALAESFTGGLISDWITNTPGSSAYFLGSTVTYSNESKLKLLHVSQKTLQKFGAVSQETALEMVQGVKKLFKTDCAISSTGIAGPGGATPTKPVGLCFLGAICKDKVTVKQFNFGKNRRFTKERGTAAGLELMRRLILDL